MSTVFLFFFPMGKLPPFTLTIVLILTPTLTLTLTLILVWIYKNLNSEILVEYFIMYLLF